jgi:hypothetical protein
LIAHEQQHVSHRWINNFAGFEREGWGLGGWRWCVLSGEWLVELEELFELKFDDGYEDADGFAPE